MPAPQIGSHSSRTPCGVHRADLLEMMAASLPEGGARLGHRCIGYEPRGSRVHLAFDNGVTAEADIVIAADGIHSRLQRYVVPPKKPVHSGVKAYRGLVPRQAVPGWPGDRFQLWMGDHKHFVAFPVRGGDLINYVAFVPSKTDTEESWSAPGDSDELRGAFEGWDPRVVQLLQRVDSCFWWGLYDREPLERWVEKRLTLLGDAAHPPWPFFSRGPALKTRPMPCFATRACAVNGLRSFSAWLVRMAECSTRSTETWCSEIKHSLTPVIFADGSTTMMWQRQPFPIFGMSMSEARDLIAGTGQSAEAVAACCGSQELVSQQRQDIAVLGGFRSLSSNDFFGALLAIDSNV